MTQTRHDPLRVALFAIAIFGTAAIYTHLGTEPAVVYTLSIIAASQLAGIDQ